MPNLNKLREEKLKANKLQEKLNSSPLHKKNKHKGSYDFPKLIKSHPALKEFCIINQYGTETIKFSDAKAVKTLNTALLKHFYNIEFWDIPAGYLCPPIPGRVDYIHYLADLLAQDNTQTVPHGRHIKVLDIGTGASLVYPLTGQSEYGWSFTGTDIDADALKSAQKICEINNLNIDLRRQDKPENIFRGVIKPSDAFHLTMCNPPFHSSLEKASKGTQRKWANLGKGQSSKLNFGGQNAELWCPGGEVKFIANMIKQSVEVADQCMWFTSLVSKKDTLSPLQRVLSKARVVDLKIVEMAQGQKVSRFIAWTFMKRKQRTAFSAKFSPK